MIQIRCSRCGTVLQVAPHQAGTQVACAACASPMLVPASAAPAAHPSAAAPMARPAAAAPMAQPAAATAAPVPPHLIGSSAAGPAERPPDVSIRPSDEPPPGDDLPEDEPAGLGRQIVMGGFWMIVVAAVVVAVYTAFAFLPDLFDSPKRAERTDPPAPPVKVRTTPWTDASQENLVQRIRGVQVRVTRVEFSDVMAKDVNNTVQRGSPFLQVFVRVENASEREIDYRSWYGNVFRLRGRKSVATLVDGQNRKYRMMTFQDVVAVKGHVPQAKLKTRNIGREKKYVDDVLIFEVPEGVVPEQIGHLRLVLPAAAVDRGGEFKFQIPGSMVNEAPPGPPLGEPP